MFYRDCQVIYYDNVRDVIFCVKEKLKKGYEIKIDRKAKNGVNGYLITCKLNW